MKKALVPLLRIAAAIGAGVGLALLLQLTLGGQTPISAVVSGTVVFHPPGSQVVVVASRMDCLRDSGPVVVLGGQVIGSDGNFEIVLPDVGPGLGYVCAWAVPPGRLGPSGHYGRWQVPSPPPRRVQGIRIPLQSGPPMTVPRPRWSPRP